jgi:hypothetical protein
MTGTFSFHAAVVGRNPFRHAEHAGFRPEGQRCIAFSSMKLRFSRSHKYEKSQIPQQP